MKVSEGVKNGLLTRSMINKRYQDDAGALSEEEKKHFNDKYGDLLVKEKEFQVLITLSLIGFFYFQRLV